MNQLAVYIGPTLSGREVRAIAPMAKILPPVEGGSLARGQWRAGDVVVLIDGYYRDRPAVRHKEIMQLTADGVHVVGAASMGALRAAELDGFGVRGVGEVYQMYKSGEIDGDDEVAVQHLAETPGYELSSIALVNLRWACRQAVAEGVAGPDTACRLLAAAKGLVFYERTWPRIQAELGRDGDPDPRLEALVRYCRDGHHDVKASDARLAVSTGRNLLAAAPAPAAGRGGAWQPTVFLSSWRAHWESATMSQSGDWISDVDVLHAARLYFDDYPSVHQEVLTGLLAETASREAGPTVPPGRYVSDLLGLVDGAPVPERLRDVLTPRERQLPTAEQAVLLAVRRWPTDQSLDWRLPVIERLKHHPDWDTWRGIVEQADVRYVSGAPGVPEKFAGLVFLKRWGVSGPAAVPELGRRGFLSMWHLNLLAHRFAGLELDRPAAA